MEERNEEINLNDTEKVYKERLATIMGRRQHVAVDIPRRLLLGATKLSFMITIAFSFYSFLSNGKDNTQLDRDEIRNYLFLFYIFGFIGAIFESGLRFFPSKEIVLLPLWNAMVQGLDNLILKLLLIIDNNCEEVDKPLCSNYDKLITYLLIAAVPILLLSVLSFFQEYYKYNSLKLYLKTGNVDVNSNFIKKPLIRRISFGVDTGLAAISITTHLLKIVSLSELLFNDKARLISSGLLWGFKLSSASIGFAAGFIVDKFFKSRSKKVFCINEFCQTILFNGYASGVFYVLSLVYFNPNYYGGIDDLSDYSKFMIFAVFGGVGILPMLYTAIRVHDEYQFKFLTRIKEENSDGESRCAFLGRICCFWNLKRKELLVSEDEEKPLLPSKQINSQITSS